MRFARDRWKRSPQELHPAKAERIYDQALSVADILNDLNTPIN